MANPSAKLKASQTTPSAKVSCVSRCNAPARNLPPSEPWSLALGLRRRANPGRAAVPLRAGPAVCGGVPHPPHPRQGAVTKPGMDRDTEQTAAEQTDAGGLRNRCRHERFLWQELRCLHPHCWARNHLRSFVRARPKACEPIAGTPLTTIQELARHKMISMTARCAHLCPDHKRAEIERLIDPPDTRRCRCSLTALEFLCQGG